MHREMRCLHCVSNLHEAEGCWDQTLAPGEDLIQFSMVLASKLGKGSNQQGAVPQGQMLCGERGALSSGVEGRGHSHQVCKGENDCFCMNLAFKGHCCCFPG